MCKLCFYSSTCTSMDQSLVWTLTRVGLSSSWMEIMHATDHESLMTYARQSSRACHFARSHYLLANNAAYAWTSIHKAKHNREEMKINVFGSAFVSCVPIYPTWIYFRWRIEHHRWAEINFIWNQNVQIIFYNVWEMLLNHDFMHILKSFKCAAISQISKQWKCIVETIRTCFWNSENVLL
jgi:hypothetical protein